MAQIKIPNSSTHREIGFDDFSGGLNWKDSPSLLGKTQSPLLQNVRVRDKTVSKRPGYAKLCDLSLGTGKINGLFQYKKADGTEYTLIAHGTKLFKLN